MGGKFFVLGLALVFLFILSGVNAYSFYATTNKLVYAQSDYLIIYGNITNYQGQLNVTAVISNSTPVLFYNLSYTENSTGSNLFLLSQSLSGIPEGRYTVNVSDGSNTVSLGFEVLSQITYLEARLITQNVKPVITNLTITNPNAMGGNFTELLELSISGTIHYGNSTIAGKEYHFVLVDQNYNQTYETLYVDDDIKFEIYNDTEDSGTNSITEKILRKGQKFLDTIVSDIEFSTGNKVFLGNPVRPVYSPNSQVNFVVMAKDTDRKFVPGVTVNVRLLNSTKGVMATITNTTNDMGFFVANFTAPSTAGSYIIDLNNSKGMEFFTVESFKLSGKVTDISGNPAYSFTPSSVVRIYATSRDSEGNPINLTLGSVRITYPNGSSATSSLTQSETGIYYYDFSAGYLTGSYGVKIAGTYSGSTQEFTTGFEVQAVSMEIEAMNINFIDQAEGPGATVNAFSPQENVTLMVFLSDITSGGGMAKGPGGAGLIDIDNASTDSDECGTAVSLVELKDDRGVSLSLPPYLSVNISNAIAIMNANVEPPPPQMMRQCVIIFAAPNRTGTYKAVVRLNYNGETKTAGTSFGIQRLYATGSSVDSKGDDYWFFAPNSTIKIKLKIKDLATKSDLPAENITSAKIVEIFREFPTYEDVYTEEFRQQANETVNNGMLIFTSPDSEGLFSLSFKFNALVNGSVETGTGSAFFQLKKYMIWAKPQCQNEGPCLSGIGQNITLTVNVFDIDQGSMLSQMNKGTENLATCTECDGLVVDVASLRNEQLMKDMVNGVDYYVVKGVVANSTANLTIVPLNNRMQSGWYGIDLIVTNPANENQTYFGWGGFEIRNLHVQTFRIESNGTDLFASPENMAVLEKGSPVVFAVMARNPATGEIIPISSVSLESLRWMISRPPVEIPTGNLTISISNNTRVYADWVPPQVQWYPYIINISGIDKEGDIQANVRVTTNAGSDIASYFFDLTTYWIDKSYRGMNEWMPVFSSGENLTVNFTGINFDESPHNLSIQGTKLRVVFNEKTVTPLKLNYSANCSGNFCTITTSLSSLQPGWYFAEFSINDTDGWEKEEEVRFMIKNLIVEIPSIDEAGLWQSDTGSKEIDVNNDRDRCDNSHLSFMNWQEGEWNQQDFCLMPSGEWMMGTCQNNPQGVNATLWSNGSMLNVNGTNYTQSQSFFLVGKNWTIVSIGTPDNWSLHLNNTDGICGEMWINCGEQGCQQSSYVMKPPEGFENHTTFYHGFTESLPSQSMIDFRQISGNENRSLFFYHNTSHIWISNDSSNMSLLGGPKTVGETFNDSYGGVWKINSLSKSKISLIGQNVLGETGAYINLSLSKSGVVKLGRIEEQWLGGWDKNAGQKRGIDLDGDGYTNSTVFIAISDSQVSGLYDTFFFFNQSGNNDFMLSISVNDPNISHRTFGKNDTVILLSIDPRADRIRFYSNRTGDWANLGDFRMDGNISIPVIVKYPNGSFAEANISIPSIRVKAKDVNKLYTLGTSLPNTTINGTGEIRITNISQYNLGTGEYVFEIRAGQGQSEEILEEWKWPRAVAGKFLVDSYTGQAGYAYGFKPVQIIRYDWENYGEIQRIYTANWTSHGKYFKAVIDFALYKVLNPVSECNFVKPENAGENETNATIRSQDLKNPIYYYYITAANESRVWVKTGDCNFSTNTTEYLVNDPINVTLNGHKFMMRVLDADAGNQSVIIGIRNEDFPDSVMPVRVEEHWGPDNAQSNIWFIMGININGTDYNVVLANDTRDYPMCSVWNIFECTKKAWFSTTGNFSQAVPAYAGDNFTNQLYLAKIGPGPWEGIHIANFSTLEGLPRPAIDVRVKDNTVSKFISLNEAELNLDLNIDGDKSDTFYAVLFDDRDDGQQNLNSILTDDDLNITEEWWSESNTNTSVVYRKDFYGNESGSISEKRGSLPTSIWSGNAWFGEQLQNQRWEYQPNWRIEKYNGTAMLLMKDEWEINGTRNITILLRAYNFDQTPIQGANVSIAAIKGNVPGMGFWKLNESQYSVQNVINVTNQDGYAILTIVPSGTWSGEYMVDIQTTYGGTTQTTGRWFRVI